MKLLKIDIQSITLKADPDDEEQLRLDVYDRLMAMIESEVLAFSINEDQSEDDEDY